MIILFLDCFLVHVAMVFNCINCLAKTERTFVNDEMGRQWNEGFMVYFKVLHLRHLRYWALERLVGRGGGVEWIHLAQGRNGCGAVVNAVTNLRVLAARS
jgi:hypothetical protein